MKCSTAQTFAAIYKMMRSYLCGKHKEELEQKEDELKAIASGSREAARPVPVPARPGTSTGGKNIVQEEEESDDEVENVVEGSEVIEAWKDEMKDNITFQAELSYLVTVNLEADAQPNRQPGWGLASKHVLDELRKCPEKSTLKGFLQIVDTAVSSGEGAPFTVEIREFTKMLYEHSDPNSDERINTDSNKLLGNKGIYFSLLCARPSWLRELLNHVGVGPRVRSCRKFRPAQSERTSLCDARARKPGHGR